jgi:YesN/AraC family two-component response regulator
LGADHLEKNEQVIEKTSEFIKYQDERVYSVEVKPTNEIDETGLIQQEKPEYSILIIEDNPDLSIYLSNKLCRNYEILLADNGITALQQAFDNIPDLIISDVVLPGKDGIVVTNTIKNDFRTSHIPVILLTAKNAEEEKIEGMKSMADAYISKPFNLKFLEETIKSLLKNRDILRGHYTSEISHEMKLLNPKKLDRKFINEFTSIIENNISNEKFTIDELCQMMSISRVQLYRKVKALLGYNINDYILNVRLQKAKSYLNEGSLSISEISYKVGFASPAYFSTVFKSKFSKTPSEYKEK